MSDRPTEIKRLEALVIERERFAGAMERAYNSLQHADRRKMDEAINNYLMAVQTLHLARIAARLGAK